MGGIHVKLLGLSVEKLHGCYNYEVSFNHDVTFIYGTNGCGKTTILNITEAIITGQLFKLFSYSFTHIELRYSEKNSSEIRSIIIDQKKRQLVVTFDQKTFQVEQMDLPEGRRIPEREHIEMLRRYFDRYPVLSEINGIFNYVYLPLSRTHTSFDYNESPYYQHSRFTDSGIYGGNNRSAVNMQDKSISAIEDLISRHCSHINFKLNSISNAFRNSILQSSLSVLADLKDDDFVKFIGTNHSLKDELSETQKAYLSILEGLNINISKKSHENIEKLFDEIIKGYDAIKERKTEGLDILRLYYRYCEFVKIKSIVKIAGDMEERKAQVRKPIELFLDTMKSFISNTEDGKEIKLDPMGQVYFVTKHSKQKLSVHNLSSGEKQLLIFFANLVFNVKPDSSGIFVVDEPELSLHLDWQRIFVEKTMEINPNLQLIFATHAPEIIGRHRNKMFKLVKEYAK